MLIERVFYWYFIYIQSLSFFGINSEMGWPLNKKSKTWKTPRHHHLKPQYKPSTNYFISVIKFIYCRSDLITKLGFSLFLSYFQPSNFRFRIFPTGEVRKVMDDMLSKAFDPETPFTADLNAKVGKFLRVNVTQKFSIILVRGFSLWNTFHSKSQICRVST